MAGTSRFEEVEEKSVVLRMRLRADDTHYVSDVIPAATYLAFMADAGALLGLRQGETAGYLARWEAVDFSCVCRVGEFIEVRAETVNVGNRSRRIRATVHKIAETLPSEYGQTTKGSVLQEPKLVASGEYVGVIPRADLDARG